MAVDVRVDVNVAVIGFCFGPETAVHEHVHDHVNAHEYVQESRFKAAKPVDVQIGRKEVRDRFRQRRRGRNFATGP